MSEHEKERPEAPTAHPGGGGVHGTDDESRQPEADDSRDEAE